MRKRDRYRDSIACFQESPGRVSNCYVEFHKLDFWGENSKKLLYLDVHWIINIFPTDIHTTLIYIDVSFYGSLHEHFYLSQTQTQPI